MWATRVKVISGDNGSTTSTHTRVDVSRLHAHPAAHSFSKMLLLPLSGTCQEWKLGIQERRRVSAIMGMYLPHPPTLSTQGQLTSSGEPFLTT